LALRELKTLKNTALKGTVEGRANTTSSYHRKSSKGSQRAHQSLLREKCLFR
jgi:hypothetical protein